MARLLDAFGFSLPLSVSLAAQLRHLESFAASNFDFRSGGTERWEAEPPDFPSDVSAAVAELYDLLESPLNASTSTEQLSKRFDHLLVLGGQFSNCLDRADLAVSLAARLDIGQVWGLASRRPLAEHEELLANRIGVDAGDDETAALRQSLRMAHAERSLAARTSEIKIRFIVAEPQLGAPRATTRDTYKAFAEEVLVDNETQRLLLVTSRLHAPFQHTQALQVFTTEHPIRVITVGAAPAAGSAPYTTGERLQETLATLRSMRQLNDTYAPEGSPSLRPVESSPPKAVKPWVH